MMNREGDRTDSCFTPPLTGKHSENWLSSLTTLIESEYQFFMRRQNLPFTPILNRCSSRTSHSTESNAFSRSKKQRVLRVGFSSSSLRGENGVATGNTLVSSPDPTISRGEGLHGARCPNSWTVPQNEERPIKLLKGYVIVLCHATWQWKR